jgi:hypothetical protein
MEDAEVCQQKESAQDDQPGGSIAVPGLAGRTHSLRQLGLAAVGRAAIARMGRPARSAAYPCGYFIHVFLHYFIGSGGSATSRGYQHPHGQVDQDKTTRGEKGYYQECQPDNGGVYVKIVAQPGANAAEHRVTGAPVKSIITVHFYFSSKSSNDCRRLASGPDVLKNSAWCRFFFTFPSFAH